jgi:thymidylate synthase ThyX
MNPDVAPRERFYGQEFSVSERRVLGRFFTNLDSPVFAIINLPEVVKGALFARYSRSPKSLRRLFLDEFYEVPEMGLEAIAEATEERDPAVGLQRAEALYDRVFIQFGDDSVAQLGGAHLAVEQASNLLTKVLEWGRLGAYLEQSTRYIFYDQKLGERYRYSVPDEITSSPLVHEYVDLMEWLFDTYSGLVSRVVPYYETLFPQQQGDSNFIWRSTIRAKACDDLRGLLPASTQSNVGIFATGQSYELMLMRMQAHPLEEAHHYADLMLGELRQVIPAFMKRLDVPERGGAWIDYLRDTADRMGEQAAKLSAPPEPRGDVTLVDWDPDAELKIAAAALYPYTSLPDDQILATVRKMTPADRADLIRSYVGARGNRRHKPGRGMERSDYRFDILCDYGIFRDLQRHRMLTIDWQRLSPIHGYVTPESIPDIGASAVWDQAMERTASLHSDIEALFGPDIAQYAIPFAYRIRFFFQLNAREAFHLLELRTGAGGHPDYRRICQEMHSEIRDRAGHTTIADAMSYVDHSSYDLARLEGERRAAAKRAALGITDPG